MSGSNREKKDFEYDVCLSFAGEDRPYVKETADHLKERGIRVFYDEYERVELWGKDLYSHLADVYQNAARYCVLFVSKNYAQKLWTNHERKNAQARAFSENREYILPARFDNTEIPGLPKTVGHINLRNTKPLELSVLIEQKIGPRQHINFFPPLPDRLYKRLMLENDDDKEIAYWDAHGFFSALKRMNGEERIVVFSVFLHSCPAELPDNVHIDIDLLRRLTKFTPAKIQRIMGGIRSLGFSCSIKNSCHHEDELGDSKMLYVEWHNMTEEGGNATIVASEMIQGAIVDYCDHCGKGALERLDFSQLSSSTTVQDDH
jgi:hypothetical protein